MRAVVVSRPGSADVLELREVPDPIPGPGDVRVRVRATAVNRADILQRRGLYPAPAGSPADIPGLEFAGEVETVGPGTSDRREGDRVMGILGGGGYAELVTLPGGHCLPVPANLSWAEAAAIPEAFLTAHDALFARAGLRAGESVLVHAAASGVGTAAVQIARAAGARVIATSRSPEKRRRLGLLGVGHVLDPARPDIAGSIVEAAGGSGVDVALDFVGAGSWALNLEVLATLGRLVLVGTLGGSRVEADLSVLLRKRLTVVGTVLRSRSPNEKETLCRDFASRGLPLLADGRLRPVIDRVLPLEEAAAAHTAMEAGENFGKIVLRVS